MQGDYDEATDRWFGMFRSVGVERLGEARALAMRRAQLRTLRELASLALFSAGLYGALVWWQPSTSLGLESFALMVLVISMGGVLAQLRSLYVIRPEDNVEFFEGRAPLVQGFRDRFTDELVSARLIGTDRSHRLTVHLATAQLLEVDGSPVKLTPGKVVLTARVSVPLVGAPPAIGDRRPLTAVEAEELEAITSRSALRGWVIALACGSLAFVLTFCVTTAWGSWRYGGPPPWASLSVFLVTTAVVRLLQAKSAEALSARVASDLAGGLVRGSGIWRLPVLDIIWERDGLPSFKRLEAGGLARARRSPARPQAF